MSGPTVDEQVFHLPVRLLKLREGFVHLVVQLLRDARGLDESFFSSEVFEPRVYVEVIKEADASFLRHDEGT